MNPLLRHAAERAAIYLGAAALAFACGFPLFWMALTSVKPDREIITATPSFWTGAAHLDAYRRHGERGAEGAGDGDHRRSRVC